MCNYREDVPAIVSHDDAHDYKSKKFHQTAEQGNTTTLFNLVLMCALGKGVPKNTEKADTYMKQACSKDNQGAVRHMAKLIH